MPQNLAWMGLMLGYPTNGASWGHSSHACGQEELHQSLWGRVVVFPRHLEHVECGYGAICGVGWRVEAPRCRQ